MLGESLEPLFSNQNRIVTGHDLYRTLRELMDPVGEVDKSIANPAIPPWSYNIFHQPIINTRTCVDAKVPQEFCPCEEEVYNRPPSLGVCNTFDQYGDLFCSYSEDGNANVILPDVLEL